MLGYLLSFKKKTCLGIPEVTSKNNGLFFYLRLNLGVETVSCLLLLSMVRMDKGYIGERINVFMLSLQKNNKK